MLNVKVENSKTDGYTRGDVPTVISELVMVVVHIISGLTGSVPKGERRKFASDVLEVVCSIAKQELQQIDD